jgi:death on curing protein
MTTYLTVEQVLFIHARLISETGGVHGVRDLGLLLSAISRPEATFDGKELYPGLNQKAASLLQSLVGNHPFVDGNKRTAITSVGLFLLINGWRLNVENQEMVEFTLRCAQRLVSLDQIAAWFETNLENLS